MTLGSFDITSLCVFHSTIIKNRISIDPAAIVITSSKAKFQIDDDKSWINT